MINANNAGDNDWRGPVDAIPTDPDKSAVVPSPEIKEILEKPLIFVCPKCDGVGKVIYDPAPSPAIDDMGNDIIDLDEPCPLCNGKGYIIHNSNN